MPLRIPAVNTYRGCQRNPGTGGCDAGRIGAHRPGHVSSGVPCSFTCRRQMYAVTIAKLVKVVIVNLRSTPGAAGHTSPDTSSSTRHYQCNFLRKEEDLNAWHRIGAHAYAAPAVPHRRWYMKNHRYSGVITVDAMPATCRHPRHRQHAVMRLQLDVSQLSNDFFQQQYNTATV